MPPVPRIFAYCAERRSFQVDSDVVMAVVSLDADRDTFSDALNTGGSLAPLCDCDVESLLLRGGGLTKAAQLSPRNPAWFNFRVSISRILRLVF